jgi:16S rRNA (guanine527-N7)-methyltransferase
VKHSSVEQEPDAAALLFGERIDDARRLAEHLVEFGETLGLIGPRELERLWTRHLVNSALVGTLIRPGTLADIGSGAGFPGLVLAIMRPDVSCTLIEPMERRATWLREEADRLGLDNVEVLRARAQDVPADREFQTVTARAVSALKKLVPMTRRLVAPSGQMVFLKGQRLDQEIDDAQAALSGKEFVSVESLTVGSEYNTEETRIFRATLGS